MALFTKAQASGMDKAEAEQKGFGEDFKAFKKKYGGRCIPISDQFGYRPSHNSEAELNAPTGMFGTYGDWKGITGPGAVMKNILNNKVLTIASRKAISEAHAKWCDEYPLVTRSMRAAAYADTHKRLSIY